ncbi:MAG: hypothetical protein ACQEXJ_12515 [Myxococcota bacterium]
MSVLAGVCGGLLFSDVEFGILLGVMGEGIALLLAHAVNLGEVERNILHHLSEQSELFHLMKHVAETDETHLTRRFNLLRHELRELAEGRYTLESLEAVYEDDKDTIRSLRRHDVLRSTCPVTGTHTEIEEQFRNKSLLGSIEAHKNAANRGVVVARLFRFDHREHYDLPIIREHMDDLEASGVECFYLFPNESEYAQVHTIPTDFVVFGTSKVSVGVLNTRGVVAGANVNYAPQAVEHYIRQFRTLIDLAERHVP